MMMKILLLVVLSTSLVSAGEIDEGLLAYYSFDEPADLGRDYSGNNFHGATAGAESIPGRLGNAAFLNGASYIQAEGLKTVNWGTALSVSVWFEKIGDQPDYAGIVNAGYGGEGSWEIRLEPESMGGKVFGGISSLTNPSGMDCPSEKIAQNEWIHAVMIYDGSRLEFYTNGRKHACPADDIGRIISNGKSLNIGRAGEGLPRPQYFKGRIDEVRIYSRVLRSDEIAALGALPGVVEPAPAATPTSSDAVAAAPAVDLSPAEPTNTVSVAEVVAPVTAPMLEPVPVPTPTPAPVVVPKPEPTPKASEATAKDIACCDTLRKIVDDWRQGHRERALKEIDAMSRNAGP